MLYSFYSLYNAEPEEKPKRWKSIYDKMLYDSESEAAKHRNEHPSRWDSIFRNITVTEWIKEKAFKPFNLYCVLCSADCIGTSECVKMNCFNWKANICGRIKELSEPWLDNLNIFHSVPLKKIKDRDLGSSRHALHYKPYFMDQVNYIIKTHTQFTL